MAFQNFSTTTFVLTHQTVWYFCSKIHYGSSRTVPEPGIVIRISSHHKVIQFSPDKNFFLLKSFHLSHNFLKISSIDKNQKIYFYIHMCTEMTHISPYKYFIRSGSQQCLFVRLSSAEQ